MSDERLLRFPASGGGLPPCTCDGRGWSIVDRNGREFAQRCARCHGLRLVRQFGDQVQTWETWAPRAELEEQVKALRAWRGTEYWATLLWGGVGTGKTHALQATGHEWLGRGFDVRYTVVPEYFDRLRRSFNDDTMRVPELGEFEGLLLLDELGSDKQTEWTTGVLERAIGLRYRCGFPTLIATNLELNALGVHFPRLADRLFEGALLHWQAPSWRRR